MSKHKKARNLYLICSADSLETAFFCGTSDECAAILDMKVGVFYSMLSKRQRVWNFFRIEKVKVEDNGRYSD